MRCARKYVRERGVQESKRGNKQPLPTESGFDTNTQPLLWSEISYLFQHGNAFFAGSAVTTGQVIKRSAFRIASVNIGTGINKQLGNISVCQPYCNEQRCFAMSIFLIRQGSGGQQELHTCSTATVGMNMQGCITASISCIHLSSIL